jgi:hypothetical protein
MAWVGCGTTVDIDVDGAFSEYVVSVLWRLVFDVDGMGFGLWDWGFVAFAEFPGFPAYADDLDVAVDIFVCEVVAHQFHYVCVVHFY